MPSVDASHVKKVIIACDAGMGSSVMLASTVKKQLKGTPIVVEHTPVDRIPADADVIMCHAGLAARARVTSPDGVIVPFHLFLGDPAVTKVINTLRNGGTIDG